MFAADLQNDTRSTVTQVDSRGAGSLFFSNISEEYIVLAAELSVIAPSAYEYDDSLSDEDLRELFDMIAAGDYTQAHNSSGLSTLQNRTPSTGVMQEYGRRGLLSKIFNPIVNIVISTVQVLSSVNFKVECNYSKSGGCTGCRSYNSQCCDKGG
jgi:hypothetical protein